MVIWLDKHEENSSIRYFVKKCVEDGHMVKPYELWSAINRGSPIHGLKGGKARRGERPPSGRLGGAIQIC